MNSRQARLSGDSPLALIALTFAGIVCKLEPDHQTGVHVVREMLQVVGKTVQVVRKLVQFVRGSAQVPWSFAMVVRKLAQFVRRSAQVVGKTDISPISWNLEGRRAR